MSHKAHIHSLPLVVTFVALGMALLGAVAAAQDSTSKTSSRDDDVLERVQAADDLVRKGDFDAARRILRSTLEACGAQHDACKIRVETSLGWHAARRADAMPQDAPRWRDEAVTHYRRALALRPDHPRLRSNLVLALAAAGRRDDAARVATTLAEDGSPEELVLLGDVLRRQGDAEAARQVYFRAESAIPDDDELHRRLLATYRQQPGDPAEHKAWCKRLWQRGKHGLAGRGLEELVRAADDDTATWALVHWADQSLAAESLTLDAVERLAESLPDDSPAKAPARQLARLLATLDAVSAPWWTGTTIQAAASHVAARALGRVALDLEARGDAEAAADALELARRVAPDPEEYRFAEELAGRTPVWMDLTTELAALYGRTGDERGFAGLEQELFNIKGLGYRRGDLASIHRLHTVLGQIYAARGQWRGGRFTNAVFQLDQAISTAAELATREGREPPPLPHLRMQLAKGQQELGDFGTASKAYREAAMEYLRLDEPQSGLEAVVAARRLTAEDSSLATLESIARTRLAVASAGSDDRIEADTVERSAWLAQSDSDLPKAFLEDQQFKVWSDLAGLAERRDRADLALQYQLEALTVAPEDTRLNRGDRLRVEQLRRSIEGESFDPERLAIDEELLRRKLEHDDLSGGETKVQG